MSNLGMADGGAMGRLPGGGKKPWNSQRHSRSYIKVRIEGCWSKAIPGSKTTRAKPWKSPRASCAQDRTSISMMPRVEERMLSNCS